MPPDDRDPSRNPVHHWGAAVEVGAEDLFSTPPPASPHELRRAVMQAAGEDAGPEPDYGRPGPDTRELREQMGLT